LTRLTATVHLRSERTPVSYGPLSALRQAIWRKLHDPLQLVPRVASKCYSLWVCAVYPFRAVGRKASFHFTCDLRNPELMEIGDDVIVHKDVWLHAWPGEYREDGPSVSLGDRCLIGRRSHISGRNSIVIEADVIVSAGVLIQDHGHAYTDPTRTIREQGIVPGGRIRIGQGCWIGQGAVIVCPEGELLLGRNCVVAANAVVTKGAPDNSVISGNPARVIKQFDPTKGAWVLGSPVRSPELQAQSAADTSIVSHTPATRSFSNQ
jgi:acetyltransferase-like isoleucine patch superfamily enzyme